MITHNQLVNEIESLVDQTDLQTVLQALSRVCFGKASDWQDKDLSTRWETAGLYLKRVSQDNAILNVS